MFNITSFANHINTTKLELQLLNKSIEKFRGIHFANIYGRFSRGIEIRGPQKELNKVQREMRQTFVLKIRFERELVASRTFATLSRKRIYRKCRKVSR